MQNDKLIIVINGQGGVGKDTLIRSLPYCTRVESSIDPVKALASLGGWQGEKDEKGRKLLSDLKRAFSEYNDLPNCHLRVRAGMFLESDDQILFVHIREASEIRKFLSYAAKDCPIATVLVFRGGQDVPPPFDNPSDAGVYDLVYDYTFDNTGKIEDCKARFAKLIADIASEKGIRLEATA